MVISRNHIRKQRTPLCYISGIYSRTVTYQTWIHYLYHVSDRKPRCKHHDTCRKSNVNTETMCSKVARIKFSKIVDRGTIPPPTNSLNMYEQGVSEHYKQGSNYHCTCIIIEIKIVYTADDLQISPM